MFYFAVVHKDEDSAARTRKMTHSAFLEDAALKEIGVE